MQALIYSQTKKMVKKNGCTEFKKGSKYLF